MVYTQFKHLKLTDAQREKFVKAVSANTYMPDEKFCGAFASFMERLYKKKVGIGANQRPIAFYRGSTSKKAPVLDHRSMAQSSAGLSSLLYFATDAHWALWCKYKDLYEPVTRGVDLSTFKASVRSADIPDNNQVCGGEVHFLQEPGLKLRAIASPYLVHQEALRPFGSALFAHMRSLPWDCTHDHMKPVSQGP